MSIKEAIITKVMEAGGRLTVRSALNPILWLCAIITAPSVACLIFVKQPPSWLPWLAFIPIAAAIFGFFFLLFFDRDKLQSETYQIRKLELEMIHEKGYPSIPAASVEVIPNPKPPRLLEGQKEQTQ